MWDVGGEGRKGKRRDLGGRDAAGKEGHLPRPSQAAGGPTGLQGKGRVGRRTAHRASSGSGCHLGSWGNQTVLQSSCQDSQQQAIFGQQSAGQVHISTSSYDTAQVVELSQPWKQQQPRHTDGTFEGLQESSRHAPGGRKASGILRCKLY